MLSKDTATSTLTTQPLQQLITPQIRSQLQQFMQMPPQTTNGHKSKLTQFMQSIYNHVIIKFYHFDLTQNRKFRRLLSYSGRAEVTVNDPQLRAMQTKVNLSFLGMFVLAMLLPKGWVTKSFSALFVLLAKTVVVDRIVFYRCMIHEATTKTHEQYSQQYRNILLYSLPKKIEKQENEKVKQMFTQIYEKIYQLTKQYDTFKNSQHLL